MVRIFPDRIRIWSGLEGFLSVCIRFRVSNIHNWSVSECSKVTFLWCRYPLQYYPAKTNTIRIQLRIRTQIWKQIRYQWYPSVFDPFSSLFASKAMLQQPVGRSNLQTAMGWMQTLLGFLKFTLKHVRVYFKTCHIEYLDIN